MNQASVKSINKDNIEKKDISMTVLPHINTIEVYTDGSLRRTSKGILCGYGVHFSGNIIDDIAKPFVIGEITNNRAELYAIYIALKKIRHRYSFDLINIYTDSEYSQKSLTVWIDNWKKNGWKNAKNKPVENQDIIKKIDIYLQKYKGKINIQWVRGHTGKADVHSDNNKIADRLANQGAEEGDYH